MSRVIFMSNYGEQDVRCPFFRGTSSKGKAAVICEGVFSDTTSHGFRGNRDRRVHMSRYCCRDYKRCAHAEALEKKYREPE